MSPSSAARFSKADGAALPSKMEWPTVAVGVAIYAGWLGATFFHAAIPLPLRVGLGGWLIAWHGSLQHEAIHGHPTPWRRVNRMLAAWPLSLWLPFELYRRSHLEHHAAEHLTLPGSDPESRYLAPGRGPVARMRLVLEAVQASLVGRLALGPLVTVGGFLAGEARGVISDPARRGPWAVHLALVAVVLAWVKWACGMSLAEYVLVFVYPGTALSLLRAFAEHRADADPARRIAVVECAPLLGLLFLNNNLHVAHHLRPGAAWNRLPAIWRGERARVLAGGGPVYAGYREVFARYLFRPHDRLIHPELDGRLET
ncbi:MAG: fatty acid desaturase [Caulobacteraceae bacterium]